ncbi:GAF domain-containing protein [Nocardiopsis alba]|uniref:GAF domain-containing protein n=1 Tax=Nocardiopsis alba TaxID=53437 RepID=UPI0033BFDF89
MTTFHAISPGTDLPSHARALSRTRDQVIGGSLAVGRPRTLVARSWSRVLEMGLDPDGGNLRSVLPADQVEHRRRESPLSSVVDELHRMVGSAARLSRSLMVVTDADGIVLWRDGATGVRMSADRLGFAEGARWTESAVGTNAIGTALAEAQPVELFAAEHFEQCQLPWYCTAAPIHDPRTGRMLGVVDVSGPALTLHPMVAALVAGAASLVELRLAEHHRARLERLRVASGVRSAGRKGPYLLVDDDGWVAEGTGPPSLDRVAAPAEGRALAVPGMGLCMPERVGEGWLLRPPSAPRRDLVELRLDLSGEPTVEVVGGGSWRSRLTTRHAEILLLMHLVGQEGIGAAALSRVLYGDEEHVVSVRAEISRLRRALGSVLTSRPYRVARGVRLKVATGDAERLEECVFVRRHVCPGVRAMIAARGGA